MKGFYLLLSVLFILTFSMSMQAQDSSAITLLIKNDETNEAVAGATVSVKDTEISAVADAAGRAVLKEVPAGTRTIEIFFPGYETKELQFTFPLADQGEKLVRLTANNEVGSVTVTSTRTGREIEAEPTRVEVIDDEEIDEKSTMRSVNVSMVLNESTGIKVQQTSATSNTQSVRIQGLDGRYTQILKDGFPSFGGFSGSISLLDIPPLDLKQVEIIKGPSATFYGGGAIAGVVNFISKEPGDRPVTSMIFNQTSALGTDFSLFHTRKIKKIGYSFLGSANYQKEYDADDDDFTELPQTFSFSVSPRLFVYADEKTRVTIGNSTTYQNREGGDIFVVRGQPGGIHQYFEHNHSFRNITTLNFEREFAGGRRLSARQSFAFFGRKIDIPGYEFKGSQFNSYTDVTYFHPIEKHALAIGFNAVYDNFDDRSPAVTPRLSERRSTVGGYIQDSFDLTSKLSLEAGFRLDAVKDYGVFALPRVSVLYRVNDNLSSRFSIGLGYKTPSIFTEDAETLLFQSVLPVGNTLTAEQSRGGTFDVNYRNRIGEHFTYSVNQMFFYTEISDPLVLNPVAGGFYRFSNAAGRVTSRGFETNVRLGYDIVKLFAGYTYTNAMAGYLTGNRTLRLTPKSKLNSALLFEKEEDFKAGFEAYYTSNQYLTNGSRTPAYWVLGIFGEKIFGKFSIFVNAENITDTRQGRFGQVVFPPHQNPTFAEIFTHTEGRVFNGGIKIRL